MTATPSPVKNANTIWAGVAAYFLASATTTSFPKVPPLNSGDQASVTMPRLFKYSCVSLF